MRRKTDAEFKKQVCDLVGNEYTFLEPYINKRTKIKVNHNKCGNVYEVRPGDFINHGRRCPYCFGNLRKTDAQFKHEVKALVSDEYVFLDAYTNEKYKLRVKHNQCGNIYKVTPDAFLRGGRCPYCASNARKTNNQFKQEVKNLVGDEYLFLEPYQKALVKIKVKHNKCGSIYEVKPSDFLNGERCPYCNGNAKKTNTQFQQEVYALVGEEYTFLGDYINNSTRIKVEHTTCGHTYKVRPKDFISGSRCPYCNTPKGELIINKILKSLNINYEYQKTFDDLKDTRSLSYDFYIPGPNILIEYQGRQHYEPVDIFGGGEQFKLQQKHDKMKSDYAKAHHYNLITVPYTYDTLSKIKKYLIEHGLISN